MDDFDCYEYETFHDDLYEHELNEVAQDREFETDEKPGCTCQDCDDCCPYCWSIDEDEDEPTEEKPAEADDEIVGEDGTGWGASQD